MVDDPLEEEDEEPEAPAVVDDELPAVPALGEPPLVPPPVEVDPTVPLALLKGSSEVWLVEQAAVSNAAQPARTAVHCIRGRLGH